jgi:hypothetical protein
MHKLIFKYCILFARLDKSVALLQKYKSIPFTVACVGTSLQFLGTVANLHRIYEVLLRILTVEVSIVIIGNLL